MGRNKFFTKLVINFFHSSRPIIEIDLDQIIQTEDGEVEVKFNPKSLTRISSSRNSNFENQSIRSFNINRRD